MKQKQCMQAAEISVVCSTAHYVYNLYKEKNFDKSNKTQEEKNMGAWGTNLYQNDVAGDIKQDYISKQKAGKSEEQALEEVIREDSSYFEDDDDKYDAWFALADTMWKYGRLTEEVKQKALSLIEEEKDSGRWETPKDIKKRQKVLEDLSGKLQSEQPPKKRISVHKPFVPRCQCRLRGTT